jgi:hypothetical protein
LAIIFSYKKLTIRQIAEFQTRRETGGDQRKIRFARRTIASGPFEAAIGILAETAIAFFARSPLLRRKDVGERPGPLMSRFAAFGTKRFVSPGGGGIAGDDADILEQRFGGAIAMIGFLSPAQGG